MTGTPVISPASSAALRAKVLLTAGLVLLCINPSWTQGPASVNLLLALAMTLSPLVLLLRGTRVFIPAIDLPASGVCVFVMLFPHVFHPESIRLITMLFTCACCVYFMMLARLARISGVDAPYFCKTIRCIVYAFMALLLIQQLCVLAGFPVFNMPDYNPTRKWWLNTLTAEASHTSYTLGVLMYFYSLAHQKQHPNRSIFGEMRRHWPVWLCFVWILFTTMNTSAYLFGPMALLPYLFGKRWKAGLTVMLCAVLGVILMATTDWYAYRVKTTLDATLTLDESTIIKADSSSAARIVPTIVGAKAVVPFNTSTVTGHGTDADKRDLPPRPYDEVGFAGMFSMWYNYGLPAALCLWTLVVVVTLVPARPLSWFTMVFALFMSAEHNLQLFWVLMACSLIYKGIILDDRRLLRTRSLKPLFQADR